MGSWRSQEKLSWLEVDKLIGFWTSCLGATDYGTIGGEFQSLDSAAYSQLRDLAMLIPSRIATH